MIECSATLFGKNGGVLVFRAQPTLQVAAQLSQYFKGDKGDAGTLEIGEVTTLAPGSPATAENVGTPEAAVIDLGIPAGLPGAAATIAIGDVTTLAPGEPATAENVGTPAAAVIDLGIPAGLPGAAATIAIGDVTTLAPGAPATAENVGTPAAAVIDLGIPAGAPGTPIELQFDGLEFEYRYVGAGEWTALIDLGDIPPPYIERDADWTLALTDRNVDQWVNSASARVCTIPLNATVAFPIGTKIPFLRLGAGTVTIDAVAGVTLNGVDGGSVTINSGHQGALATKTATDAWSVSGDVSAAA